MSVDIQSLSPLAVSNQITYNYGSIDVLYTNCYYITNTGSTYKVTSPIPSANTYGINVTGYTPNSSSNISFPNPKTTYRSTDIYITPLVHKIVNITDTNNIVGELIIKHSPVGGIGKIYLCFLLSYNVSTLNLVSVNDVDNIVDFIASNSTGNGSITTILQQTLNIQTSGFKYTNNNKDSVLVFTNPINIGSSTNTFLSKFSPLKSDKKTVYIPDFLLPVVPPSSNAVKLTSDNILISGDDNIYMDCQPTGASADEIKAYSVPINSEYTTNASKIEAMSFVVQVTIIFAIMTTSYLLVPKVYKWFIIDNVNKFVLNYTDYELNLDENKDNEEGNFGLKNNQSTNSQKWVKEAIKLAEDNDNDSFRPKNGIDTHIRIATIDVIITAFYLLFYFAFGFSGANFNSIITGFYFAIFFVLSLATIQFNKLSKDYFQTNIVQTGDEAKVEGFEYPKTQGNKEVSTLLYGEDIISLALETVDFMKKDSWFIPFLIFILGMTFIVVIPIYLASTNKWSLNNLKLSSDQKTQLAMIIIVLLFGNTIFYGIFRMIRLTREEWNNIDKVSIEQIEET